MLIFGQQTPSKSDCSAAILPMQRDRNGRDCCVQSRSQDRTWSPYRYQHRPGGRGRNSAGAISAIIRSWATRSIWLLDLKMRAVFACKDGGRDKAFAFVSQEFHIRQATP